MKKPDFLGEINKEILEELTKRGRARNVAGLVGEVKELAEVTQICGLPFAGYLGKIEIPRPVSYTHLDVYKRQMYNKLGYIFRRLQKAWVLYGRL